MAYLLGDITLPNPKRFERRTVEMSKVNDTINGTTKKDIVNRKEQFVLDYTNLTQAQVASILSEYNTQITREFEVTESNLTISATEVHIDIPGRAYNTKGDQYREDLTLILTEVI